MAITSFDLCNAPPNLSNIGLMSPTSPGRLMVLNVENDDNAAKRGKQKKKKNSSYLQNEKVQMLSRITEKRLVHNNKKNEQFSSFPFANNIYKANSDEFKIFKKNRRKSRKSVLTLPNVPAPIPQTCTVSDMNEPDYLNHKISKPTSPKRLLQMPGKRAPMKPKGFEYYDRDTPHLHMDVSSSDFFVDNNLGDENRKKNDTQDVWAVLRNINKFQFRPSPRISDESIPHSTRKKKLFSRRYKNIGKGRRLVETYRTEEVAYVANFEIQGKDNASPSSSIDRITVINKNELPDVLAIEEPIAISPVVQKQNKIGNANITKRPLPFYERNLNRGNLRNGFKSNAHPNYRAYYNPEKSPTNIAKHKKSMSIDTMDSSNCFRNTDSNSTLKSRQVAHPDEIMEIQNKQIAHPDEIKDIIITNGMRLPTTQQREIITRGMTQLVCDEYASQGDNAKPKPRLVTTMPSAAAMPKFTTADLRKRIGQIRFPIIVLGKDQISTGIELANEDAPHLDGLDKHIWPFMVDWQKKMPCEKIKVPKTSPHLLDRTALAERATSNVRKVNNDTALTRKRDQDRKFLNGSLSPKKKIELKRVQPAVQWDYVPPPPPIAKKTKPMKQFKDKMLRLLYKKTSAMDFKENFLEPLSESPQIIKVDIATDPIYEEVHVEEKSVGKDMAFQAPVKSTPKRTEDILEDLKCNILPNVTQKLLPQKQPWAKAKWASEFIDNVMKKIKNGSYYSLDDTTTNKVVESADKLDSDVGDNATQTAIVKSDAPKVDFGQNFDESKILETDDVDENDDNDLFSNIPGFDEALPELEIKSLNFNEISVKHCLTNVTVQFDVTVPNKQSSHTLSSLSSSSVCTPLSGSNSQAKIFKCSTTLLNAVLPAELCTVIPKLMRGIFDSGSAMSSDSHVTVSEISESDSSCIPVSDPAQVDPCLNNPWMYHHYKGGYPPSCSLWNQSIWSNSLSTQWLTSRSAEEYLPFGKPEYLPLYMSPKLALLLGGRFSAKAYRYLLKKQMGRNVLIPRVNLKDAFDLLRKPITKAVVRILVDPMYKIRNGVIIEGTRSASSYIKDKVTSKLEPVCNTLEVYQERQRSWIPSLDNFSNLLQKIWSYCKFNIHFNFPVSSAVNFKGNEMTVNMVFKDKGNEKIVSLIVHRKQLDSIYKRQDNCVNSASSAKCIEYPESMSDESSTTIRELIRKDKKQPVKRTVEKYRKSRYVKLYKKCKSTSNIDGEKTSTSLTKITNLDEFLQALGTMKSLSSVFDGRCADTVMACVGEVKSWIKEVTPRQAMLILLLSNKTETANVLKFRPVLLQGIAVNRITRASELDMEIEVIERENIKVSQCEGVSYIPATIVNQDNLFEELCWIAKTTASDYQKPFNEASEKLLKSLLEKRKKLNPSYLRVMARYVGLGLLKTPTKQT